ncbi:MAG: DUF255 domain-containing protein, partial [Bacteroidales bacterium]|nr:DUF255 domain-containing protein [Bacteroidales bacterium]
MKKLILFGLIVLTTASFSFAEKIKWYSWEEAIKMAKKENKPMMVFVYAPWCHVCKKMNDKTFGSADVITTANKDFIPVKFDIEKEGIYTYNGKEYSGMELISKLSDNQFRGIPSTMFYSPAQ